MQATLLGIAFALILALIAALVGPAYFPWSDYRSTFEAEASRLTGLPLRITGPIDARLLPTPKLTLGGVELAVKADDKTGSKARIGDLRVEFSLSALIRGDRRISQLRIDGPDLTVSLDASGHIAGLPAFGKFEPDLVAIEKLEIENGRIGVASAASGTSFALERLDFSGDMRSLAGPLKGEGSFVIGGQHYPYRIGGSRVGDDGAMRVKLTVDPIDRPIAEADGALSLANGMPRFDGALTLSRAVGLAQANGRAVVSEPWRVGGRIKADGGGAVLEQIELQYGPEERAIKLRGDARMTFGPRPQIVGVLSAPSVDIDRVLGLPDETRRKPLAVIKSLGGTLIGGHRLPFPVKLGLSAETVTFAGALLQRVSGDITLEADGWDIEQLEFRAPGFTQMRMSGRLTGTAAGASFAGPVKLEANDPRAFIAWLTERNDIAAASVEPLRLAGNVTIGGDTIGVEYLKAELDRVAVEGRIAYNWANGDKPARFDASLRAPELDVDRAASVLAAAFSDTAFDWPREGALAFEVGRATLAGVEARNAAGKMWLDRSGFMMERLSIADFGGAALNGSGRIDTTGAAPRGTMAFELDARRLDGATALVEKLSPRVADLLRRASSRVGSGKLNVTLSLDDPPARAPGTLMRFTLDGRVGEVKLAVSGGATAAELPTLPALASARSNLRVNAKIEADDAVVLVGLLGLDRIVAADKRAGQMTIALTGPLDELRLETQITVAGLEAKAEGSFRPFMTEGPEAILRVDVANADLRQLRPSAASRAALPARLKGRLALRASMLALDEIDASIAGAALRGNLNYTYGDTAMLGGAIEVDAFDLPLLVGAASGLPQPGPGGSWSSEPFRGGPLDAGAIKGRIALRVARATLTPKLAVEGMRGMLVVNGQDLTLDNIEGALAGGRMTGQIALHRDAGGLTGRLSAAVSNADAAVLLPGARVPLTGKISIEAGLDGTGLSPAALLGSLGGTASFKLDDAVISGLDIRAFDSVVRAVDQGLALERIAARAEQAMGPGKLAVQRAEGAITILGGQARLGSTAIRAEAAELTLTGGVNLATGALDARIAMTSDKIGGDVKPEIVVNLSGPVGSPQRSLDMSSFASWLALRAVEQQAKKLNALEEARRVEEARREEIRREDARREEARREEARREEARREEARREEARREETRREDARREEASRTPPPAQAQPAVPQTPAPQPSAPPAARAAPALPPPIDIRPAPAPRADAVSR